MEPKYLPLLNKSETAIRYSKDQGGGYMVELEVFHQIHCLVERDFPCPLYVDWRLGGANCV